MIYCNTIMGNHEDPCIWTCREIDPSEKKLEINPDYEFYVNGTMEDILPMTIITGIIHHSHDGGNVLLIRKMNEEGRVTKDTVIHGIWESTLLVPRLLDAARLFIKDTTKEGLKKYQLSYGVFHSIVPSTSGSVGSIIRCTDNTHQFKQAFLDAYFLDNMIGVE